MNYLRFINETVLLIFQLWLLRDSEFTGIFELTGYLSYFGNKSSWQYFSNGLNLLFGY